MRYFHKCGNIFLSISVILVRVSLNLDFLDRFLKKKKSNVNKIRPVGAELFHVDMTKLIVAFRNLANVRRKRKKQDTSNRFVGGGVGFLTCGAMNKRNNLLILVHQVNPRFQQNFAASVQTP